MPDATPPTPDPVEADPRFAGKNPLVGRWQWQALPGTLAGARWAARQSMKPLGLFVMWLAFGVLALGGQSLDWLRDALNAGGTPQQIEAEVLIPTWFRLLQHGVVFVSAVVVVFLLLITRRATRFQLGLTMRPRVPGNPSAVGRWYADVLFLAKLLLLAVVAYTVLGPIIWLLFPTEVGSYIASPTNNWITILHLAVLAPVGEELFFRGVLYGGLRREFRPWEAGVISALLFAVTHYVFNREPLPVHVNHLIGGFVFAYVYERTGSIWPGILVHAAGNTSVWVLSYVAPMVGLI